MSKEDYSKPSFSASDAQSQAGNDITQTTDNRIQDLDQRISYLENKPMTLETDLIGLFETVSAIPTGIPRTLYDQIKIYVNSTTLRLYWYDANAHVWHYVTATA